MIIQKTWKEFREAGMFWWINQQLHMFGWALTFDVDGKGNIVNVNPARVKFRGFTEELNEKGYQMVSQYLAENIDDLVKESKE